MSVFGDLLALQEVDSEADMLVHRRRTLPERRSLADTEERVGALRTGLDEAQAALADVASRLAAAEGELASVEERRATIRRRLYSGEVSASRDLQAMSAEEEHLAARASDLEDSVLALMEEREPLDARCKDLDEQLVTAEEERSSAAAALAAAEAELDARLSVLAPERAAATRAVPAPLVTTYERLRSRLGGVAVARLVGNHCDGCHLTLSSVELERVRHLEDGDIYTCEQCSRIIVPAGREA